jgi:hypothetical protein
MSASGAMPVLGPGAHGGDAGAAAWQQRPPQHMQAPAMQHQVHYMAMPPQQQQLMYMGAQQHQANGVPGQQQYPQQYQPHQQAYMGMPPPSTAADAGTATVHGHAAADATASWHAPPQPATSTKRHALVPGPPTALPTDAPDASPTPTPVAVPTTVHVLPSRSRAANDAHGRRATDRLPAHDLGQWQRQHGATFPSHKRRRLRHAPLLRHRPRQAGLR